jgi:hypothetical protein
MVEDLANKDSKPPKPQFLDLSRPSSYSAAGIATDARLAALCRPPEAMAFSPIRGLTVYARRGPCAATPLDVLSAPKHPPPANAAALLHATAAAGRRNHAPSTTATSPPPARRSGAAASPLPPAHYWQQPPPEDEADATAQTCLLQQAQEVKAAAEVAAAAADGWGVGDVWERERPVLSRGFVTNRGGRVRSQHKHLIGQDLIRGGGGSLYFRPTGSAVATAAGCFDMPRQPHGAAPDEGAERLRYTGAFLRSWVVRRRERRERRARAAAAAGARAGIVGGGAELQEPEADESQQTDEEDGGGEDGSSACSRRSECGGSDHETP